jgi:hypothetical protein
MILSGCSTRQYKEGNSDPVVVLFPAALMQKLCSFKPPGDTVATLSDAYVENTICGKKYEAQLEEQIEYHRKMATAVDSKE